MFVPVTYTLFSFGQQHLTVPSITATGIRGTATFKIKSVVIHLENPLHYIVVSRCNNDDSHFYIQNDFGMQPLMGPYSWAEVSSLASGKSTGGKSSGVFALYSRTGVSYVNSNQSNEYRETFYKIIHNKATDLLPHAHQAVVRPYQSNQKHRDDTSCPSSPIHLSGTSTLCLCNSIDHQVIQSNYI